MKNTLERRVVASQIELRKADGEGSAPTVTGYAAVFGSEAVIGGMFRERIEAGAFRNVITAGADVRALFNHDDNLVLGRTTNGTLRLSEDERGLRYEFDPNLNDPDAVSVLAKIQRGDVSQSSYGFRVAEGGETWTKPMRSGELPLRTITAFDVLRDVSPVTFPAFEQTSVSAEARSAAEAAAMPETMPTKADATDVPADEQAEDVQYAAMADLIASAQVALTKAAAVVASLQSGQETSTDADAQDAEDTIERAQFSVLRAHLTQASTAACSAGSIASSLSSSHGDWGWYSAKNTATLRAELDVLEAEL
jgi:hypothetical protein